MNLAVTSIDRRFELSQFDAALARELGVEPQNLDREVDLVDDALARPVPATEQFEVLGAVVRSNAVDVVDGLIRKQFSSKLLLHNESMLESVARRCTVFARNDHADVTMPGNALSRLLLRVIALVGKPSKEGSALGATQTLESVYGPAGTALNGHSHPTLDAIGSPVFVGQTLGESHTLHRAVERVFLPLLSVGGKIRRLHFKWAAALFTFETDRVSTSSGPSVLAFKGAYTLDSATFLRGIARTHLERLGAFLTDFLNRHVTLLRLDWYRPLYSGYLNK